MYKVFGIQPNQQQVLVANPLSAREALTNYRASQKLFSSVDVHGPDGEVVDGFELNRRADEERKAEEDA